MSREAALAALLDHLSADSLGLDMVEILDILWLAGKWPSVRVAKPGEGVQPEPEDKSKEIVGTQDPREEPKKETGTGESEAELGTKRGERPDKKTTAIEPATVNVPQLDAGNGVGRGGLGLATPGAKALPGALALARALRPFRRRVNSRVRTTLDEEATANRAAEQFHLSPVMRPWRERWFELALLIDTNASMVPWQATARDFRRFCESVVPFRDVRTWHFHTGTGVAATLGAVQSEALRNAGELFEPSGRRIVLIVSDCLGEAWASGKVAEMIASWGKQMPVAILQMFPQSLWRQTALADSPIIRVRPKTPVSPNARFAREALNPLRTPSSEGVAVPLFCLEPAYLSGWADLLTGKPRSFPAVVLTPGKPTAAWKAETNGTAGKDPEKIVSDLRAKSPEAGELASLFAAVSPLRLPLFRLIQETMLPDSRQFHLAEVLQSGLLKKINYRLGQPDEAVEYCWEGGVFDYLLNTTPIDRTVEAHRRVSYYVERRLGIHSQFSAILSDPEGTHSAVAENAKPFAEVSAAILRRLGGKYAEAAARLARTSQGQDDGAPAVPTPDEVKEPAGDTEQPAAPDWGGKCILWIDKPTELARAEIEKTRALGANIFLVETSEDARQRLVNRSFDAIVSGISRERLKFFTTLQENGNRTPLLFFSADSKENRSRALKLGAIVCTDNFEELIDGLDKLFGMAPDLYTNRKILLVGHFSSENVQARYEMEAKGARFVISSGAKDALDGLKIERFDAIVSDLRGGGELREGLSLLRQLRAAGNNIPYAILGTETAENRDICLKAGATVATDNLEVVQAALLCCAFEESRLYLSVEQAVRFIEWQVENFTVTELRDLLTDLASPHREKLWSGCSEVDDLYKIANRMISAVFERGSKIVIHAGTKESDAHLSWPNDIEIAAQNALERDVGYLVEKFTITSLPLLTTLDVISGDERELEPRQRDWLVAIVSSLGQALQRIRLHDLTQADPLEEQIQRGLKHLTEEGIEADRAKRLMDVDPLEWEVFWESFPTTTEVVHELIALVEAIWQPRCCEAWVVSEKGGEPRRFTSGVSASALKAGKSSSSSSESSPAMPDHVKIPFPDSVLGRIGSEMFLVLLDTELNAFLGSVSWLKAVMPTMKGAFERLGRFGGFAAEFRLGDKLPQWCTEILALPPGARAAVFHRAIRRAIPLLLLNDPPDSKMYEQAFNRMFALDVLADQNKAFLWRAAYSRESVDPARLQYAVDEAEAVSEMDTEASSFGAGDRRAQLLGGAIAQALLCQAGAPASSYRDFFIMLEKGTRFVDRLGWADRFDERLMRDMKRAGELAPSLGLNRDSAMELEAFGDLWELADRFTPWALEPRSFGGDAPARRILVLGTGTQELGAPLRAACRQVGVSLARLGYGLTIGCWPGVDIETTRSYVSAFPKDLSLSRHLLQIVEPNQIPIAEEGATKRVQTYQEALDESLREVDGVIVLHGMQGTEEFAREAIRRGIPVFPIGETGGVANELILEGYKSTSPVPGWTPQQYSLLAEEVPVAIDLLFHLLPRAFPAPAGRSKSPQSFVESKMLQTGQKEILRTGWSPDGKLLATASADTTVRIWDLASGKSIATLEGHSEGVNAAVWSPDGQWLATASFDKTVRLWSTKNWKSERVLHKHDGDVTDVIWSVDGWYLASASADSTICIWDFLARRELRTLRGQAGEIRRLCSNANSTMLWSCSMDGSVWEWPRWGTEGHEFSRAPGSPLTSLSLDPRGRYLVTSSYDLKIVIYSLAGARIRELPEFRDVVRSVAFSPDGRWLAANGWNGDSRIVIWDTNDWSKVFEQSEAASEFWPCSLSWAPNGPRLATPADYDKGVRILDIREEDLVPETSSEE